MASECFCVKPGVKSSDVFLSSPAVQQSDAKETFIFTQSRDWNETDESQFLGVKNSWVTVCECASRMWSTR